MPALPPPRTVLRRIVDITFGIVVPILCFIFDPTLLKLSPTVRCGIPILGNTARYFVYPAVTLGIVIFTVWLLVGSEFPQWGAFISGIFLTGAGLAIVLGVPFVFFGFVAWIPGFVYWRNGRETWQLAEPTAPRTQRVIHALGGVVFVLGVAGLAFFLLIYWFPPVTLPPCPDV